MTTPNENKPSNTGLPAARLLSLFFGLALIALGGLLLVGQLWHLNLGAVLWPLFILAPGLLLFVLALLVGGNGGEGLAVVGGIITTVGLILLFQNMTGLWATWAYAWALIAPTSVGVSLAAYGLFKGRNDLVKSGSSLTGVGLVMFLAAAAFFELALNISGLGFGPLGLPIFLIALGVVLVIVNIVRALRK